MSEAGTAPLEDEFGDIIGKARRGLGLEPGEAARRAGLDEAVVRSMEDYERQPTRAESDGLAAALELDAPSLWDVAVERLEPAAAASGTCRRPAGAHDSAPTDARDDVYRR